jgi:hypothetical protein
LETENFLKELKGEKHDWFWNNKITSRN